MRRLPSDQKLTLRMAIAMFLLAAVYLLFAAVLWRAGVGFSGLVLAVAVMLLTQYYLSDRLVLWSMGAREVSQREASELHAMVERLSAAAGLPRPRVAVVKTAMPNAFATGRSPRHSVVAVTTGLLEILEPREVEAVLAHEISHIRHRDVAVMTVASFFATVAAFIVQQFMFWRARKAVGADAVPGAL
jgi:heat shock protein HtpX